MSDSVTVHYGSGTYRCGKGRLGSLQLAAKPGRTTYVMLGHISCEESVRHWLGNFGLSRRLARRLLDAAIRGTGPLADPKHPRRVA